MVAQLQINTYMKNTELDTQIVNLYNGGMSNVDIAQQLKCSTNTVWRHLKKHNVCRIKKSIKVDWKYIQDLYDSGLSETDLRNKNLVSRTQLENAKQNKDFIPRTKDEINLLVGKKIKGKVTHTEESKNKISKAMILRHENGTAYTLGHNERLKKRSYPEQWFDSVIQNNITNREYTAQYSVGKYCLDFAWISEKKCVEIDGETHYRFQTEIDKDIKRDAWLKEQGWTIIRFRWKDVLKNKTQSVKDLQQFIDGGISLVEEFLTVN